MKGKITLFLNNSMSPPLGEDLGRHIVFGSVICNVVIGLVVVVCVIPCELDNF